MFLLGGWNDAQEAVTSIRDWGKTKRKGLDKLLGVKGRVDDEHPEVIERKKMPLEEEREYLAKRYLAPKLKDSETADSTGEQSGSNS